MRKIQKRAKKRGTSEWQVHFPQVSRQRFLRQSDKSQEHPHKRDCGNKNNRKQSFFSTTCLARNQNFNRNRKIRPKQRFYRKNA